MKNVLVLTTTFPRWKNDNMPTFVFELSKQLKEEGLDMNILAPHYHNSKLEENIDRMKVYRYVYFYPKKYQKLCYDYGVLPSLKRSHLAKLQLPLLFFSELLKAVKVIKKEKIDVIHSHWIMPHGLIGAIIYKILKKEHVLTIHAADLYTLDRLPFKHLITNFIANNSNKISIVSSYGKERLLKLISPKLYEKINKKIKILPMGVYTNSFKNNVSIKKLRNKYNLNSKHILLFIGRLSDKKGVNYLIKAMSKVKNDVQLLIIGYGPLENELKELTKKLNLQNKIKFLGYIGGQEKVDYFLLSDILILPSIVDSSGDTEGLPVVLMEGLAAGKAIIATDVGGNKDIIKDNYNGFLIEQKNPDLIANRINKLISNKKLREKFSKNALEISKDYDWKIIGRKYADLMVN